MAPHSPAASLSPALRELDHFRHKYVGNWAVNAENHEGQGHYVWMAEQVDGYLRTLEIGCGTGLSTLALLAKGHKVICIEENPYCIEATRSAVDAQGYRVAVLRRAVAHPFPGDDHRYRLDFSNHIPDAPEADCLIIEGDALEDEGLENWLRQQPSFDLVVCWLLGTHDARGHNAAIDVSVIKTAFEHRIFVQNKVYEMADEILRPGGILNVVDRSQMPNTEKLERDLLDAHREQASVTSLQVQGVQSIAHVETLSPQGMRMMMTLPGGQGPTEAPIPALVSVTAIKP